MSIVPAGAATPTKPGPPKIQSAKPDGKRAITITFGHPASDGGSHILSYQGTCTSSNGGVTGTHSATGSPVRVPSLTAGKTYTCTVSAKNGVGVGKPSAPSAPVVARPTGPSAPKLTAVKATGLRSITVTFTKPTSDGGAPISFYLAACKSTDGGTARTHQGSKSPIVVAGLTAAATYTCTVAAGNAIALGTPSAPSAKVFPRPVAPGAPTITAIKSVGERSVLVTIAAPANDGGAPIADYLVRCISSNGGAKRSRLAPASPVRVSGLTNGKTYTCNAEATNNVRFSAPSAPSKPVVART